MIAPKNDRLLHLVGYAVRGGCERCCEVFIRYSHEYRHHVIVFGERGPMSAVWEQLGATVEHLDILRLGWIPFYARLRAALRGADFHSAILWAGIRVPLVLAILASFRRPVVLHAGNPFTEPVRVRLLLEVGRLLPRPRAVVVVGCSVHVARSYRHAPYFRHLPVESCLNPVETPPENPHRPRRLTPADPVRIGMVARLDPIKDHAMLLRAFGRLRAIWPRAELHLAGEGPLRPALERLAAEEGLAGAVHFHGSIAQVAGFLRSLDLFAYFTTDHEGMGNALAEALAQGLPAVVNDLGVMREVGGEGEDCAVRFTRAEPVAAAADLDAVLRDVTERATLSDRAFARARSGFAPRRVVERYLALLEVES